MWRQRVVQLLLGADETLAATAVDNPLRRLDGNCVRGIAAFMGVARLAAYPHFESESFQLPAMVSVEVSIGSRNTEVMLVLTASAAPSQPLPWGWMSHSALRQRSGSARGRRRG